MAPSDVAKHSLSCGCLKTAAGYVVGAAEKNAVRFDQAEKSAARRRTGSLLTSQVGSKQKPQVLAPAAASTALRVAISGGPFDALVSVSLEGAKTSDVCAGLSTSAGALCKAECRIEASYTSSKANGAARGIVKIVGFPDTIAFCLGQGAAAGQSWLGQKGRVKQTALSAPKWDWRSAAPKPTEGKAADVELNGIELRINLRAMSSMELKRSLQLQALLQASEDKDYDTLRAQITKARMASVENEHILRAEAKLKEMRKQGLHVNEGCDHGTIRDKLQWTKVTDMTHLPAVYDDKPCCASASCPCNIDQRPGEDLQFNDGEVQEALSRFGPDADRMFFDELASSALAVDEGCIWQANGKLIFSEFNRNQSVTALVRMLVKHGKQRCADMVSELVTHTESKYQGSVTAIQVNVHLDATSCHLPHRDIYSIKQSAGPNCTCQFQDCVGTVCYTLGSSRLVRTCTMTDQMSHIEACGEKCEGRSVDRWLHSGNAMYFNVEWNNNHLHGIPQMPSEDGLNNCGPRISLAFLLAPKAPMVCAIKLF
eukprot:TRINITY_DN25973_c0_g1_i1.p1 TRINITY_DN25973_c0_g1~~TRINITY_DN25973_c0_g1_i1.p1  ORF type:complete len:541 (-),score=83.27 TRINITY_DN25973_c0_g1_i1:172-1794(-)